MGIVGFITVCAFIICLVINANDVKHQEEYKRKKKAFDDRYQKGLETEYPKWYK